MVRASRGEQPQDHIGSSTISSEKGNDYSRTEGSFFELANFHGFHEFAVLDISDRFQCVIRPVIQLTSFSCALLNQVEEVDELGTCRLFERLNVSTSPFGWTVGELPSSVESVQHTVSSAENGFNTLLSAIGIKYGYCIPVHSALGKRAVVLFFSKESQNVEQYPALVMATLKTYNKYFNHSNWPAEISSPKLSELELKLLQLVAAGKTSSDIAKIVSLSEQTIYYCSIAITKKLGATNISHALSKAIQLGLPVL